MYGQKNSMVKHERARPIWEDMHMGKSRSEPAVNFQRNLRALVARHGDTSVSLAEKTGLSQRTCYNLLKTSKKVSIDEAEVCGHAYGYTGWQMIMPELPPNPNGANRVLQAYCLGSDGDREFIEQASARIAPTAANVQSIATRSPPTLTGPVRTPRKK